MFEVTERPRRGRPVYPLPVPPPSFGLLLRRYRERAGWSCNALARRIRVDPSYISRLERGDRGVPRRPVVLRLSAALALGGAEADRLLLSAGYAPPWLMALAEQAQIGPREAVG